METTRKYCSFAVIPPLNNINKPSHRAGQNPSHSPIQDISHQAPHDQPDNDGQRHGVSGRRERDTGDEYDGLDPFSQDGDEGKKEHCVFLSEALQPPGTRSARVDGGLEGLGQLYAPLLLHLADAEEGYAYEADDNGGYEREGALIVVLVGVPGVAAYRVEGADDASRDDEADEKAQGDSQPYLFFISTTEN